MKERGESTGSLGSDGIGGVSGVGGDNGRDGEDGGDGKDGGDGGDGVSGSVRRGSGRVSLGSRKVSLGALGLGVSVGGEDDDFTKGVELHSDRRHSASDNLNAARVAKVCVGTDDFIWFYMILKTTG